MLNSFNLKDQINLLIKTTSFAIVCVALFILLGAFVEIPSLYRPLTSGEATHPFTAILSILASIQAFELTKLKISYSRLSSLIATSVTLLSLVLVDKWLDIHFVDGLTNHIGAFSYEKSVGLNTSIGTNTCVMFFAIAVSHAFAAKKLFVLSFVSATCALLLTGISYIGYFVGENDFYGHMSLTTLSIGTLLSLLVILNLTNNYFHQTKHSLIPTFIGLIFALIGVPFTALILVLSELYSETRLFNYLVILVPWCVAFIAAFTSLAIQNVDKR